MTLNVSSINNKISALEQYRHVNRVHISVITETHLQGGGPDAVELKGYTLVSSCCRKQGRQKGGVAIYVHERAPFVESESEHRVVDIEHEMECCAATVLPNHNSSDRLVIVGIYRPPQKKHPPYAPTLRRVLQKHREQQGATILMGDINIHSWQVEEGDAYQEWVEEAGLWELSDPSVTTYRTGTVTDGMWLALGSYQPEGILPMAADPETDG